MAYIAKSGHKSAWDPKKKIARMDHVIEYEKRTGKPKPKNKVLHHTDNGKTDSSSKNIKAISRKEHGLLHTGRAKKVGGKMMKKCSDCDKWLAADAFYGKRTSRCPQCYNKHTEANRK